jgi:hypothetical protein
MVKNEPFHLRIEAAMKRQQLPYKTKNRLKLKVHLPINQGLQAPKK